jgi:hypothetical protein
MVAGSRTVSASYDGSGSFGPSDSATTLVVDRGDTTLTLSVPGSVELGAQVTVEVRVDSLAPSVGVPNGTVDVSDGRGTVCVISLFAGHGTCTFMPTAEGSSTLAGSYSGDDNFLPSSSDTSLDVTAPATP